jgi:hypothetical protein
VTEEKMNRRVTAREGTIRWGGRQNVLGKDPIQLRHSRETHKACMGSWLHGCMAFQGLLLLYCWGQFLL